MRLALVLLWAATATAQTADKSFWAITAGDATATGTDAFTTVQFIGGERCPREVWNANEYGKIPTPQRVTAIMGGWFAVSVGLSYAMKRRKIRVWKIPLWELPQGYNAYGHTWGAVHNFRFCR